MGMWRLDYGLVEVDVSKEDGETGGAMKRLKEKVEGW